MVSSTEELPSPPSEATRPTLHRVGPWRERLNLLVFVVVIFALVNLATQRFFIDGESMAPNFHNGQFLIVSRAHYLFGHPAHGDIVVFDNPGDDNTARDELLIKRLIGLPGDRIRITDGAVYVNDVRLNEPYINPDGIAFTCLRHCDLTLGPNEYFFMGDNRNHSNDSRAFGPIPRERIVGEAIIRYWPPQDWGLVTRIAYPAP